MYKNKILLYDKHVLTISTLFSTKMLNFFKKETTRINKSTLSLSNNCTSMVTILLFFIFISTLASSARFRSRYVKTAIEWGKINNYY